MRPDDQLFEGKYRVGELLGEGGMGVVHAAVHVYSGAEVAIKTISKAVVERHALGDRLLRESRVLALLDHPNIVRLFDCGPTKDGDLYIVMERVDGDPLRALIRSARKKRDKGALDLDLSLLVMAQIAEAMDFSHRKGVYHRDLKPENIIVRKGGHAKVLDFGLAKTPNSGPGGVSPTNPANVVGTPRYMAPEQVRAREVDGRTDVYALGVVFYECLSGHTPYDSNEDESTTVTELLGHHVFAEPRPLRELVPCPERVWRIINRCLAKDPKDRYPDMASLARELRTALEIEAERAKTAATQPENAEPGPREVRVTEPMPRSFRRDAGLPFGGPPEDEPMDEATQREARVTEPMPELFTPASPLPFAGPHAPRDLGKGHTLKLSLRDVPAAVLEAPPSAAPPSNAAEPERDSADAGTRSGPGFVFDPTLPEGSPPPLVVPSPPRVERSRRLRIPPYFVTPVAGLVLAVLGMIVIMAARDPRSSAAPHPGGLAPSGSVVPPPTSAVTASASADVAVPLSTAAPPAVSAQPAASAPPAIRAKPIHGRGVVPRTSAPPIVKVAEPPPTASATRSPGRVVQPASTSVPSAPPPHSKPIVRGPIFGVEP